MGRTNPTYRRVIQQLREDWQRYRRALRHGDQQYFDQLFDHAEDHADAAGYLNPDDPMTAVLFSIVLAQERKINKLQDQVATLQDDVHG